MFFDLDHTLWDFDANTAEAVSEIYNLYGFSEKHFFLEDFLLRFNETNNYLWDKFNHGLIGRSELRNDRFKIILGKFGIPESEVPADIGDAYLKIAPSKSKVMPHTHELLEYLLPTYTLHIISNGFDDVQFRKLEAANLLPYFDKIITSDNSGYRKPQKEIFEFAMQSAGTSLSESLFIGDNTDTDIQGALNAGMDHIYYNPLKKPHNFPVTYEVHCLREIMNIL